jgi:hypothetical protein
MATQEVREDPVRWLGLLVFLAAVAVFQWFTIRHALRIGDYHRAHVFKVQLIPFVPAAVGIFVRLLRPYKLLLDDEGFTFERGPFLSSQRAVWSDVANFFVEKGPHGKVIGINYRDTAIKKPVFGRFVRPPGMEGALPAIWKLPPDELADHLNSYRTGRNEAGR